MNFEALNALISAHPFCIPVYAAAEFLHIGEESLRASMDQCRCPSVSYTHLTLPTKRIV
mgnify:CR=1 FL=1